MQHPLKSAGAKLLCLFWFQKGFTQHNIPEVENRTLDNVKVEVAQPLLNVTDEFDIYFESVSVHICNQEGKECQPYKKQIFTVSEMETGLVSEDIRRMIKNLAGQEESPAKDSRQQVKRSRKAGIQWKPLLSQMLFMTTIQHAYRIATEEKTREQLGDPFFKDWIESIKGLRGWKDGDLTFVNYVGHPMQGSTAGFIYRNNDTRYHTMTFSPNDVRYWKMVGIS